MWHGGLNGQYMLQQKMQNWIKQLTVNIDNVSILFGFAGEVLVDGPAGQVLAIVLGKRDKPDLGSCQQRFAVIVNTHVVLAEINQNIKKINFYL